MNEIVPLLTDQDVVRARQTVRQICQDAGFSLVEQTKMVTAASELARNTRTYGGGGRMRWARLQDGIRVGIELEFSDEGPGIPDIGLALTDGWTSGNGLGMGLSGAKRLVSEMKIDSEVGKGTTVTIIRWK